MDEIKIPFGYAFDRLRSEVERNFDGLFETVSPIFSLGAQQWRPQIDICETSDEIIILGEMAGVDKEDIDVEVDSNHIRVAGKRLNQACDPHRKFHLSEIHFGIFERTLRLPVPVDPEKVTASYRNGLLMVRLAKQRTRMPHRVPITGS